MVNSTKQSRKGNTNPFQTLQKNRRGENSPKYILKSGITLITKTKTRMVQKKKKKITGQYS